MENINRKVLGDLLLEVGMITPEQLNTALEIQNATGERVGEILVRQGFISQMDIIGILEFQMGIPYVEIDEYDVDQEACVTIPEPLAKKHVLIPIKKENGILTVAMSDPLNVFAIDDVRIYTGMEVQPVIATSDSINRAIKRFFGTQTAMKAVQDFIGAKGPALKIRSAAPEELDTDTIKNAPTVKLVNTIIEQAIRYKASDIHIEPFEKQVKIRFRIDGHLKDVMQADIEIAGALMARIKILAGMDISEKRLPQDGRIRIEVDNREYDLRTSVIPIVYGEKCVIRIADRNAFLIPKEKMGFDRDDEIKLEKMMANPYGILLVTGPTGSGKSTTLYSSINEMNKSNVNIVTIEDPVECVIDGISQIQMNPKIGLTFAEGLKSILRQDPNIIMIGEIRDSETAEIAVRAAITGHLVLSTLHTNNAPSTVIRLIDMGIEPFLVASSVIGVISQRLIRKICTSCKIEYEPDEAELALVGHPGDKSIKLARGVGCPVCGGTGYRGRIGVYEIMPVTKALREMISSRRTEDEIRENALSAGMKTLKQSAANLVLDGVTTISELKFITFENE